MGIILGISNSHNGSVAIVNEGKIKSAIQAERISRQKRQPLPINDETKLTQDCLRYCLNTSNFKHSDIEAVAFSTPWKIKKINNLDLSKYLGLNSKKNIKIFYAPHHYTHMEYIAHYGNKKPGIILVIDGSGSYENDRNFFNIEEIYHPNMINYINSNGKEVISAYWFDGIKTSLIYRYSPSDSKSKNLSNDTWEFLHSIGHYWEWASSYCYSSSNEAGKIMGLAAYGKKKEISKKKILSISEEAKINLDFQQIKNEFKKPNIFNLDLSDSKHHQNLALKVQSETESVILQLLSHLKDRFPTDTLYFSGGVALNVVVNEKIKNSKLFKNVILNGSVEDNGTAIGAALSASLNLGYQRKFSTVTDYYGKSYNNQEIMKALSFYNFSYKVLNKNEIYKIAANLILKEKIFGWFHDRSEFGPRALGNRSILANPISPKTKYILDHYMKSRERYRPYAPVVIEEFANKYFDIDTNSPVMMRNAKVLDKKLSSIMHYDGTARVQTVNRKENVSLYKLLLEVKKNIGYPILLNTSFNIPGEPIVESPYDALSAFSQGSLDYLFLENIIISR